MKLSASQAAKSVGKSIPTITRAIKSGRLSAEKREGGGWIIEPSELFRVWEPVSNEKPKALGDATPVLQAENRLLREMLDDTKSDRDYWRGQAEKVTLLIEDKRGKTGWFDKLLGR